MTQLISKRAGDDLSLVSDPFPLPSGVTWTATPSAKIRREVKQLDPTLTKIGASTTPGMDDYILTLEAPKPPRAMRCPRR